MGLINFFGRMFAKRATSYTGADAWMGRANNVATGRYLTPDDALKISSFYAGTRVLAESVAMLPVLIYDKLPDGGKERNPNHPLWRILRHQPNPLMDAFQFKEMCMVHLVMRGNFYAQKIYNGRGKILELYPLNPDRVCPHWTDIKDEESLVYKVSLPQMGQVTLPREDVLHIRGLGTCGVLGLSPVDLMMQTIGIATAQEEHAAGFFGRGVRASGVLEHPNKLSKEAATRLRESFDALYSGSSNAYRTILLEEGLKWNQVSLTSEQSQFLQSRQFTVNDIARWLRVPPDKIGDLQRATFSNIEAQGQDFITHSIGPWLVRIEQAIMRQLLPEREWESTVVEFLVDALLRGDIKSRYEAYAVGRQNGFLNIDEIRERENMNPLPDDGGKGYLEPMNMRPVGSASEPTEEPASDPADDQIGNPPDAQTHAWKKVIAARVDRALRREVTARGRTNSDNGKMLEYLPVELAPEIEGCLMSFIGARAQHKRWSNLKFDDAISAMKKSLPTFLSRYAETWVKYSEENKEQVSTWQEKRSTYETNLLLELVLENYREICNECEA